MQVKDLAPGVNVDSLTVKVVKVEEPRSVSGRDGSTHRVADALVGDESGSILMTLWDRNIDSVRPGAVITVRNGFVGTFKGHMRLNLGRGGTLSESDAQIENVNTSNNLSDKVVEDAPPRRRGFGRSRRF
ncbi:single-strand DNA-binding protein [Acidilobus saccharovorans 345-15]|uniref:Single-strand DNA-binding protein n=1 Tax=Acidilobus saccharovorans (strain DSM 16705 / JCM 18335 / VKM B-2471 / 345-15) TaxID=666510 RepID=D9Q1H9_ACIS3|nr:single-stranded DNA-binding protein [Acidilobus saccharovorans]ADL19167.1 single-strand DNA-binding protein [Acidilobus saccharovorans 345-15]